MISVITSCMDRELYLKRLIDSFRLLSGWEHMPFEHFIVFNGCKPSEKMSAFINEQPFAKSIKVGRTEKPQTIGAILTTCIGQAKYPIVCKIDDDCTLASMDFLPRLYELCTRMPKGIIYPVVVDGVNTLELIPEKRQCVYLPKNNVFVTVGKPEVCSGMWVAPLSMLRDIRFKDQNDAELLKIFALNTGTSIFQCINGIVLEMQDGISGQFHRKAKQDPYNW